MSDNQEKDQRTPLTLNKGKLELKKSVDSNRVRQNFTHGRSKIVTVEVKKKRVFGVENTTQVDVREALTADKEKAHRLKVLQEAMRAEEEAKQRAIEAEKQAAIVAKELKELEQSRVDLEEEKKEEQFQGEVSQEVVRKEKEEKRNKKPEVSEVISTPDMLPNPEKLEGKRDQSRKMHHDNDDDEEEGRGGRQLSRKKAFEEELTSRHLKRRGTEERRRGSRISVTTALSEEDDDDRQIRGRSLASIRRSREKEKQKHSEQLKTSEKILREVIIPETITVQEFANRMAERAASVIKVLMKLGVMATITQTIDADTAQLVAEELGHPFRRVSDSDVEEVLKREEDKEEDLCSRPPVVTVMGHVDHGKTSLLDALRSANVAEGEAGGITQHIGAYQVKVPSGEKVTFIDTPGHAAFTAMRARGAKVTDIVILVVAANDGIMPQTIEAIHHAKAANVPIVVAINKIDVPGANPDKVRMDLLQHEVVVESLGGDVLSVEVSAKKRINLDKLVEAVLLQAEVLNLRANPKAMAEGAVIEAKMEKGRGSVATVLIQRGTLHIGDIFVSGKEWGRVRALVNEHGKRLEQALPSEPVEVIGLQGTPGAGDDFIVVSDENKAREISSYRQRKEREALQVKSARGTMEQMFAKIKSGEAIEIPVLIKGDVQGSVEALSGTLEKIANEKIRVKILHAAIGGINESDVTLAKASDAMIIGFNVRANPQARELAKRDNVEIRYYSIIYDVAEEVKKILEGKLAPELKEKIIGYADIRQVFNITKVGKVAGCMVTEGVVRRGAKVRLLRDDVVIYTGNLTQLKRFKEDVREVRESFDCGMSFENYDDLKVGDKVECFEVEEIAVHLEVKV